MPDIVARLRASNTNGAMCDEAADEIERLRKVEEVAKGFLSEWDNPTPDYGLRVNLKQRLRALCQ